MKERSGTTVLLITHDMGVVADWPSASSSSTPVRHGGRHHR
ncbi:MAG: hypothetical protein ACLTGT_06455 [Oscillospiraceae bacterium]